MLLESKNYGCDSLRAFPGNIGLWKIQEFYDLIDGGGPTFVGSMRWLQHTDALIVDVRGNSGGDPAAVALVCSFFFGPEPVHLNTLVSDGGRTRKQSWTLPHLECSRYLEKDVFVLVDQRTYSAAEEFAYDLQSLGRAKILGCTTGGAGQLRERFRLDERFALQVPVARPVNPVTGEGWEGTGVKPDVPTSSATAFDATYTLALQAVIARDATTEAMRDEARAALAEQKPTAES